MNDRVDIAKKFVESIDLTDIELVVLYGSVARGEDTKDSDIDILIVSPKASEIEDEIGIKVVDIIIEEEEIVSPHLMTPEHFSKTKALPFLTNVLNDGIVLYESPEFDHEVLENI